MYTNNGERGGWDEIESVHRNLQQSKKKSILCSLLLAVMMILKMLKTTLNVHPAMLSEM
jgi:hypothetical protein